MRIPPNFTFKPYITGSDAESFRTMLDFPLSRHVKWSLHLIPLPPLEAMRLAYSKQILEN